MLMKTASALVQFATLSALLAMHVGAPTEFTMPGVRRALEAISLSSKQAIPTIAPAAAGPSA
jgi:hypothetical protein